MKPNTDVAQGIQYNLPQAVPTSAKLAPPAQIAPLALGEHGLLRLLQQADGPALLQMELANRAWFERYIAPREEGFYSEAGVEAHIAQFLREFAQGRILPLVLLNHGGEICGRANLHEIDGRSAKLGYRLAQQVCGRGLATRIALHLCELARHPYALQALHTSVAAQNLASVRVLQKCGFIHQGQADKPAMLRTGPLLCEKYLLSFAQA